MTMTGEDILNLKMEYNDSGANTIRGYLKELLFELWREGECFDGKRPFGNSDWDADLAEPLVSANLIEGGFDDEGNLQSFDEDLLFELINTAIEAL